MPLGLFALFLHFFSFGHNNLMDAAMGYDRTDPSKSHYPLVSGTVSLRQAHRVIHWGLAILGVIGGLICLYARAPTLALLSLFTFYTFGHAYNDGLSKESLLAPLACSISYTGLGLWGWFLSHETLGTLGIWVASYLFSYTIFSDGYLGHLKELGIRERNNILVKLGARIEDGNFIPNGAVIFALATKIPCILIGSMILTYNMTLVNLIWFIVVGAVIVGILFELTRSHAYNRVRHLKLWVSMSVFDYYLIVPLLLPLPETILLILFGTSYLFAANKWVWNLSYWA